MGWCLQYPCRLRCSDLREDLGDPLPPSAAGSACMGCVSPIRAETGSSLVKRQSSAGCLRWYWGVFSLFRLPPAGSRGLCLEREPRKIPKQREARRDGGSWGPPLHPSLPKLALSDSLALLGSSPELVGSRGATEVPPLWAPRGCPQKYSQLKMPIPRHPSQGGRRPRNNPLPKGEMH